MELNKIYCEDWMETIKRMPDKFLNSIITSPPYFRLRDYQMSGQLGMEKTPELYVEKLVLGFRAAREKLNDNGTLWVNIGDSYAGGKTGGNPENNYSSTLAGGKKTQIEAHKRPDKIIDGLKQKDLIGIPWLLAFALRADGWYLRDEIIWAKPNPMPESVTDRCTRSHEFIFMFSKSAKYYYDQDAIKEPALYSGLTGQETNGFKDPKKFNGKHSDKQRGHSRRHAGFNDRWDQMTKEEQCTGMRNKRSVWNVPTKPFADAHFATFNPKLILPCVLASCPPGGIIYDPFMGAGTTALVALQNGRKFVGSELNPKYVKIADKRLQPFLNLIQF